MTKKSISNCIVCSIFLALLLAPVSAFARTEQVNIDDGWNLVGLPLTPQTSYTAESLGREINAQGGVCKRILRWGGNSYQAHTVGIPSCNFPINSQEGYFIQSKGAGTWTMAGGSAISLSYTVNQGWTLVNVPFDGLTAESMGASINSQGGTCKRILFWDGGSYQTHLIGKPFGDFPIKKGVGYFLSADSQSTWNMSVTPVTKPTIDAFSSPTNNPVQTLSGAKDANASIWMNGVEKVPLDSFTAWSVSVMLAEGQNDINITAKNSVGTESEPALASLLLDTTPPTTPVIRDDGATTNYTSMFHAAWSAQDPQTGIGEYQFAIGTSPGGVNIVNWTSCGTQTEITKTGLSLLYGNVYYFSVKARNNVGLWSNIGSSDGITLVQSAPVINTITPADGGVFEIGGTVPFNINALDPEGDAIQYKIVVDGQVVSDWNTSASFNWQTTTQTSGVKQATVSVKDAWGNENSGNISVYLTRKTPDLPE